MCLRGMFLFAGFFWALMARTQRQVGDDLVAFYQREQMQKLRVMLLKWLSGAPSERFNSIEL